MGEARYRCKAYATCATSTEDEKSRTILVPGHQLGVVRPLVAIEPNPLAWLYLMEFSSGSFSYTLMLRFFDEGLARQSVSRPSPSWRWTSNLAVARNKRARHHSGIGHECAPAVANALTRKTVGDRRHPMVIADGSAESSHRTILWTQDKLTACVCASVPPSLASLGCSTSARAI